jgi:heme/copper-type cytochrome/quinol oxidase subunit 1
MPRRISDYPDAFAGWNLISSFGSIISVVATWLFLHIVYLQLIEGKVTSRYPWLTPQFYSDTLQTLLNRSYNSLEWALTSPPKPHAFVSLPLQSEIAVFDAAWLVLHGHLAGNDLDAVREWFSQLGSLKAQVNTMWHTVQYAQQPGVDNSWVNYYKEVYDRASWTYDLHARNLTNCHLAFQQNVSACALLPTEGLPPKRPWTF